MTMLDDVLQMLRFGAVGLAATLVHFSVALAFGAVVGMSSVLLINAAGFLAALIVSFLGHYHFTFSSSQSYASAFTRFSIVALLCFTASSLCVTLSGYLQLPDIVQLLFGVVVIPIVSYIASKKIVF